VKEMVEADLERVERFPREEIAEDNTDC